MSILKSLFSRRAPLTFPVDTIEPNVVKGITPPPTSGQVPRPSPAAPTREAIEAARQIRDVLIPIFEDALEKERHHNKWLKIKRERMGDDRRVAIHVAFSDRVMNHLTSSLVRYRALISDPGRKGPEPPKDRLSY